MVCFSIPLVSKAWSDCAHLTFRIVSISHRQIQPPMPYLRVGMSSFTPPCALQAMSLDLGISTLRDECMCSSSDSIPHASTAGDHPPAYPNYAPSVPSPQLAPHQPVQQTMPVVPTLPPPPRYTEDTELEGSDPLPEVTDARPYFGDLIMVCCFLLMQAMCVGPFNIN